MSSEERNIKNKGKDNEETIGGRIASVFGCIHRANIRFFVSIPTKVKSLVLRKINDYRSKPKREDINKVYVLVGYTTKQNIDNKYNDEHLMISLRRALLVIIFVMLLFIGFKWLIPKINFEQAKQIFGIQSMEEMTNNDPFEFKQTEETAESELLTLENEEIQG